ncbi:cytochrome ubiquinol oxidase subunit I [Lyngbya sp. PCC 8106]|uniref:cytochrome ubiquinol oxidase subunit I n=1 Tax=Lyngbya sp. (strain PCC 8106) TaxID=313612 RepID=UPI00058678B7|nr:cytochrome ubiquinol oxidase subunit I [Lyngbya sp. PCC 8106]
MEFLSNTLVLSRMQFALTAIFHMLWPILTTGMGVYLVIVEGLWLKTRNPQYYYHARFWAKLYILNFGIGVASGIPMEFQFGTNWAPLSEAIGNFFGSIIGFEASMAFMLEAAFLGIMVFGWQRVNPYIHYMATILVAFGANLSSFWILVANSWLQNPTGVEFIEGEFVVKDYFQAIFNPYMPNSVLHMVFATWETTLFVIGGISAWYILKKRHEAFFGTSLKIALAAAIIIAPLQLYIGHLSGEQVYHFQPTKLAAMEAQWETIPAGVSADWSMLAIPNEKTQQNDWEVKFPNALGYILEFKKELSEPVQGLKEWPPENRPHLLGLIYYSFRIMIAIGFYFAGLMLVSVIQWLRGQFSPEKITQQPWLMWGWILAAPLGYIAVECGWTVRCVGRQPWTVYNYIRTEDAVSNLPPGDVLTTLTLFATVYAILLFAAFYFGSRIIRKGPDFNLPLPGMEEQPPLKTEPGEFMPDERPVEAQQ